MVFLILSNEQRGVTRFESKSERQKQHEQARRGMQARREEGGWGWRLEGACPLSRYLCTYFTIPERTQNGAYLPANAHHVVNN